MLFWAEDLDRDLTILDLSSSNGFFEKIEFSIIDVSSFYLFCSASITDLHCTVLLSAKGLSMYFWLLCLREFFIELWVYSLAARVSRKYYILSSLAYNWWCSWDLMTKKHSFLGSALEGDNFSGDILFSFFSFCFKASLIFLNIELRLSDLEGSGHSFFCFFDKIIEQLSANWI